MLQALAEAIKPILQRIADFFDLFDLSFFVSGGISLMAVVYLARGSGLEIPGEPGAAWALATLVLAYFLGLICFAVGRSFRRLLGWLRDLARGGPGLPFSRQLYDMVQDHGLGDDDIVGTYVREQEARPRLYARMWAEIRQRPELKESFDFINHSWVLAATYDGVAAAALVWAGALLLGLEVAAVEPALAAAPGVLPNLLDPSATTTYLLGEPLVTPIVLALIAFSVVASWEARRHGEHQAEALMATMAHLQQQRTESRSTGGDPGYDVDVDVEVGVSDGGDRGDDDPYSNEAGSRS
jgi:hypothetical protein